MAYQFYTEDEHDESLVSWFAGLERDHAHHTRDLARWEAILADATITPVLRRRMTELQRQTSERLHEVTHLIEKTTPQLPPAPRLAAAYARLLARATARTG